MFFLWNSENKKRRLYWIYRDGTNVKNIPTRPATGASSSQPAGCNGMGDSAMKRNGMGLDEHFCSTNVVWDHLHKIRGEHSIQHDCHAWLDDSQTTINFDVYNLEIRMQNEQNSDITLLAKRMVKS